MRTNVLLIIAVTTCAAISWWPLILEPTLDVPWWTSLAVIALCSCLTSALSKRLWLAVPITCAGATFIGLIVGTMLWPPEDPIAQPYVGILSLVAAVMAALVCFAAALVGRMLPVEIERHRRTIWLMLAACVAFGPVALAVRPSIIAHRVARNDRLAAERFESLKAAVERTRKEGGSLAQICDGESLKHVYSGPPFSARSWRYIAGNYVKEDGYLFGIYIDCFQPAHYKIDVRPARGRGDGMMVFCADETGKTGSGVGSQGWGTRCTPVAK